MRFFCAFCFDGYFVSRIVGPDFNGRHLNPITFFLESAAFSALSAFSSFSLQDISSDPCFFWGERDLPHLPNFPRIGFESLTSKIRAGDV